MISSDYLVCCSQVESVKTTATVREAELTSILEDHAQKISDRDVINEQVLQLQRDLELAQTSIAQQVRH